MGCSRQSTVLMNDSEEGNSVKFLFKTDGFLDKVTLVLLLLCLLSQRARKVV